MSKEKISTPSFTSDFMSEDFELGKEQQEELDSLYHETAGKFRPGSIITGTVIDKRPNGILVGIDYKSDAIIPSAEFSDYELERLLPKASIEVLLDRLEDEYGNVVLSYQKAKALKAWETISDQADRDESVRGIVISKVRGGLSVDIGIPAFLPGSQIDTQRIVDFDQFVGQEVICKILKINKKRGNVIVSRRKYLEELRSEEKHKALETIAEGQVLQGVVKNITSYGAFVDVGGIDGLLHITDMSWGRINHPAELVKIGDTVTVKVIAFDREHEKVSLGIKQLIKNPWEGVDARYPIGSRIKGKISSIADYGLFVEVEDGVEGLVHISEISWTERINHLSRLFAVGDTIEALVVALDKNNRRMSLSIKQLKDDPWKAVAEKVKIGDVVQGPISNITDFGLFVQLMEGVDGLVHISDISWTDHVGHPGDRYKRADVISVVVLAIDPEHRKVSLGIKQLDKDPWTDVAERYKVGDKVEGAVSKVTNFGAFVKLPMGIEGLVHISELADQEVHKVEDVLKVGDSREFRIIKVSPDERKLGLSLRTPREHSEKRVSHAHATTQQHQQSEPHKRERVVRDKEREKKSHPELAFVNNDQQPKMRHDKSQESSKMKGSLQQALEEHLRQKNDDQK